MKKMISLALLFCVAPLITGCGIFGGKSYNGSEAFDEAHPDYNNPPSYMQTDPQPITGN